MKLLTSSVRIPLSAAVEGPPRPVAGGRHITWRLSMNIRMIVSPPDHARNAAKFLRQQGFDVWVYRTALTAMKTGRRSDGSRGRLHQEKRCYLTGPRDHEWLFAFMHALYRVASMKDGAHRSRRKAKRLARRFLMSAEGRAQVETTFTLDGHRGLAALIGAPP